MKVVVNITEKITYGAVLTMTKKDFKKWSDRVDKAKGFDKEQVAFDLMTLAKIRPGDGDPSDMEVEDFYEADHVEK